MVNKNQCHCIVIVDVHCKLGGGGGLQGGVHTLEVKWQREVEGGKRERLRWLLQAWSLQALMTYAGWICTLAREHTHLHAGKISIRIPVLSFSAIK